MSDHRILEFHLGLGLSGLQAFQQTKEPCNLEAFAASLPKARPKHTRRIIIVQLGSFVHHQNYRLQVNWEAVQDLARLFKTHFGVPKHIFKDHVERGTLFRFSEIFTNPRLPSLQTPNESFTLPFYELRTFKGEFDPIEFKDPKTDEFELSCASTGRQIRVHEWFEEKEQGPLLIVPRKFTFWSKTVGEGWDAVILCDPPLSDTYTSNNAATPRSMVPNAPYANGYEDFIPRSSRLRPKRPPPQDSLFSDLVHYFTLYTHLLPEPTNPVACASFPKQIVASHYITVLGFLQHQVSSMQSRDWSIPRRTEASIDECEAVETAWLKFRCDLIRLDVDRILDSLAIPRTAPDTFHYGEWLAWETNFQYIRRELVACSTAYEALTAGMSALSGIVSSKQAVEETRLSKAETQRTLREAKSTTKLTVLTITLAPMAMTSSLFSMTGEYAPGGQRFWVYFVWALPFTWVVFAFAVVVDWGMDERANWSMGTLGRHVKYVLMRMFGRSGGSSRSDGEKSSQRSFYEGHSDNDSRMVELVETDITEMPKTSR